MLLVDVDAGPRNGYGSEPRKWRSVLLLMETYIRPIVRNFQQDICDHRP